MVISEHEYKGITLGEPAPGVIVTLYMSFDLLSHS